MRKRKCKTIKKDKAYCKGGRIAQKGRRRNCAAGVFMLFACVALGGCTRREQLVLETKEAAAQSAWDSVQDVSETAEAGQQTAQGQQSGGAMGDEPGQQDIRTKTAEEGLQMTGGQTQQDMTGAASDPQMICVHVCGAVKNPDVYEFPAGSRVYEAVKKAGGFTEEADDSYVNQAQPLADGVKLVIPTKEQTQAMMADGGGGLAAGMVGGLTGGSGQENASTPQGTQDTGMSGSTPDQSAGLDGKVNINTASESELCGIPGIGATRAAAIAAYRKEKGGFSSIEEIMNVSGIKEGTYEKIKDSIKVN